MTEARSPNEADPLTDLHALGRSRILRFGSLVSLTVLLSTVVPSCGGAGASPEDVERSRREFQLAATLRQEGSVPAAIERLRRAMELDPENAEAELLMGYIQMERHDAASAEAHLRRGVELLIRANREGATLAEARNIWGLSLVTLDRCHDAIEPLRASAMDELNRAPHLAWGNLALAQICLEHDPAALRALEQAVRMQPRFCVGYFRMGQVYLGQERLDDADRVLTQAIEADPSCTESYQEAYALRGEVRARLGRREEALSDFEHCVELGARSAAGQSCQHFLEESN